MIIWGEVYIIILLKKVYVPLAGGLVEILAGLWNILHVWTHE